MKFTALFARQRSYQRTTIYKQRGSRSLMMVLNEDIQTGKHIKSLSCWNSGKAEVHWRKELNGISKSSFQAIICRIYPHKERYLDALLNSCSEILILRNKYWNREIKHVHRNGPCLHVVQINGSKLYIYIYTKKALYIDFSKRFRTVPNYI